MAKGSFLVRLVLAVFVLATPVRALGGNEAEHVFVYKTPSCGCCARWVDHLRANGFTVEAKDVTQYALDALKRDRGVPPRLAACHTALVGGYVVEGHVPASDVTRLLAEKPAVAGLSVPEMPIGSPGMEVPGRGPEPYAVRTFDRQGNTTTFSRH